ncbi:hypothetical protein [Lactococcus formosensis]|nr:hypothetical protein [Lactococcus formosensis]MDT2727332.1 hypothetical protein [Lactococcus formosensis]
MEEVVSVKNISIQFEKEAVLKGLRKTYIQIKCEIFSLFCYND